MSTTDHRIDYTYMYSMLDACTTQEKLVELSVLLTRQCLVWVHWHFVVAGVVVMFCDDDVDDADKDDSFTLLQFLHCPIAAGSPYSCSYHLLSDFAALSGVSLLWMLLRPFPVPLPHGTRFPLGFPFCFGQLFCCCCCLPQSLSARALVN